MNKYIVGFIIESGLRSHLSQTIFQKNGMGCELKFPTGEHKGKIEAFLKVEAINHVDAANHARIILDDLLDSISLVMESSLYGQEVFLVLKAETGNVERKVFRQSVKENIGGLFIRNDSRQSIEDLWKKAKNPKEENALRWIRLGHRARTYHEQFIYYWLAIERFVGESQITRKCSKCGEPHTHPGIDKDKVKSLVKSLISITDIEFNEIWEIRNDVFHGRVKLDRKLNNRISSKIEFIFLTLEKALTNSFALSYKMELPKAENYIRKDNNAIFLKFNTTNPSSEFAEDYPTDSQLEEFLVNHEIKSRYGFESVEWDLMKNW